MKLKIIFTVASILIVIWCYNNCFDKNTFNISPYPNGLNFAFTITDDPDLSTFDEQKIVYDYLRNKGLITTIAVWVLKSSRSNGVPDVKSGAQGGVTCENEKYLKYLKELQNNGYELALHGVSSGNDTRENTIIGYEKFKEYFGKYPKINIMHRQNLENIYWGKKVLGKGVLKDSVGLFLDRSNTPFSGEIENSNYFWGDILKEKSKYVRLWGTSDINTLKFNPSMPYHDPEKPYVNYWFSFSDGFRLKNFNELISFDNVDSLVKERGACIAYTHFSFGFVENNKLNSKFKERIDYLASKKEGWFVPASVLLDRLQLMKNLVLIEEKGKTLIANLNDIKVENITLIGQANTNYFSLDGTGYQSNNEGEIVIGELNRNQALILVNEDKYKRLKKEKDFDFSVVKFKKAIYLDKKKLKENNRDLYKWLNNKKVYDSNGNELNIKSSKNIYDEIFYNSNRTIVFSDRDIFSNNKKIPGALEKYNMIAHRVLLYIKHNYL